MLVRNRSWLPSNTSVLHAGQGNPTESVALRLVHVKCNICHNHEYNYLIGLVEVLFLLEPLRLRIAPELTKADFNVLIGTEAVKLSLARAHLKLGKLRMMN